MLFTAIAGTVVILPFALGGTPFGDDHRPLADQTRLVQQPLTGIGGGETIREIHQDTPFSLVALTAADLSGTSAKVRARKANGSWGPWYQAEALDGVGGDSAAPRGTDPVFVGLTTTVQIAVTRPGPTAASGPQVQQIQSEPTGLGYVPANTSAPIGENINAVLISPPKAPIGDLPLPSASAAPGQPPAVITRAQWGADESMKCPGPTVYDDGVQAGIVHHTAGSNDYSPEDSAAIVRSIYAYHTRTLGWCDIAYNALVDKYGQVFEGRAGGLTRPVEGAHTGGFNKNTWGVAMLGNFDVDPPSPILIRTMGRLMGWRLGLDHVNPEGTVVLTSEGGSYTHFPKGATPTLPTIFTHRDVGNTDCPGDAAYAVMPQIRDIAAHFNEALPPPSLTDQLRGGAILAKWESMGGDNSPLGAPKSLEASAEGDARYAMFDKGAVYWSPVIGAEPMTGAIYAAWASLGYERGALGLPTSGEIQEPQWIVQNFQHGTLNFDREKATVTRVIDGVPEELPPPSTDGPPVQLERIRPIDAS
jgi:uncharacterized protein with LGFP repeats